MSSKPVILIADDSRTIRDHLLFFLRLPEIELIAVENGKLAIEQIDQHGERIAMVLSDLHMPEMGGMELVRVLRQEKGFKKPIIILTQEGDNALIKQAKDLGVNGWMIKPFKGEEVLQIVRRIVKLG
ncbi:MAG: response regulator [Oligoflexus sp.]|jgi:two-component system chemotaxis response regulator CheY